MFVIDYKEVFNMENTKVKKLTWENLALIAFVMVWGFGNVVNNFANQGLKVVGSWVLIILLYFILVNLDTLSVLFRKGHSLGSLSLP